MDEQVRRGHEVTYFFSGRQYPLARGPRLRRWERDGVAMLEVVDSPLYDHGRQPELEIAEPQIDRILEAVLAELRPDAVHVQELAGLPFSVLDVIDRSGAPAMGPRMVKKSPPSVRYPVGNIDSPNASTREAKSFRSAR